MNLFEIDDLDATMGLLESHWQFRAARVLMTAHQVGIFEALREPQSASQVAVTCQTHEAMTEKLLIACCALGLVRRQGEQYELTRLSSETMLPESLRYIGGVLDHGEGLWWFWSGLPDVMKTGKRSSAPRPPERSQADWHRDWIWAMHGNAVSGTSQWLARQVDLSGRRLLLDLGGGPGTYSIALCQRFPGLRAVVWELPQTAAIAEQFIERFGMRGRVEAHSGDWNSDEFGDGYDCMLMSNVLHGPGSRAEERLEKAIRALVPGGLLMVHDFLLDNDKSGPLPAALFNLMVGAYSIAEMLSVVRCAGFCDVSLIAYHPQRGSGVVTAVRP